MARAMVLADDLTGALDTGVKFFQGIDNPCVVTDTKQFFDWNTANVVVVDTESRNLPRHQAYARAVRQTEYAAKLKIPVLYKKTDSVLRGNIGAELEAMLLASGRKSLIFAPAFPAAKRTVEKGCLRVEGNALTETSYSKDYICPVTQNRISDILKKQTNIAVVETKPLGWTNLRTERPTIFVCDTKEEYDLEMIAKAVRPIVNQVVLGGCAGFAAHVSEHVLQINKKYAEAEKVSGKQLLQDKWIKTKGRTVICGSINERTRQQINYAWKKGINCCKLHPDDYLFEGEPEQVAEKISMLQRQYSNLLLYTAAEEEDIASVKKYARNKGIPVELIYSRIAQGLGEIVRICTEDPDDRGYAIIGGDTLYHGMKKVGCQRIIPIMELEHGIILSQVQLQGSKKMAILSKAGSFGTESAIWDMFRFRE